MAEPGMAPSTKHIVSIYTLLPMTRILLADDSIVVRQVIADFLRTEPGIEVVAESGTFTETIALAAKLNPQVILLDVHMADERVVTAERLKSALAASPRSRYS